MHPCDLTAESDVHGIDVATSSREEHNCLKTLIYKDILNLSKVLSKPTWVPIDYSSSSTGCIICVTLAECLFFDIQQQDSQVLSLSLTQ